MLLCAALLLACGDDETKPTPTPDPGTTVVFDLEADLTNPEKFFEVPYPNDLRLDAEGHPDLRGFPNPASAPPVVGLLQNASQAVGFPVIPVAHFRFTAPLAPREPEEAGTTPFAIVDIDPASSARGTLVPVVAQTHQVDPYTPENLVSIAPRPGFVLRPGTRYAAFVLKSALDAEGRPLGENPVLARVIAGTGQTDAERRAADLYAPLKDALAVAGVAPSDIAAATVFTTGRVVEETARLGDAVVAAHDVTIEELALDAAEDYPELCVLRGTVSLPQFQGGTPPFDTDGRLVLDSSGTPVQQRTEIAPVAITIPRTTMPAEGYPLVINVHGSGGYSIAMVRPVADDGMPGDPIGPSFPIATKGIAMAGFAMPLNPERFPGAAEDEYLNVENFAAMRDTFRQGVLEARLFVEAVAALEIPPATLAACTGAELPAGATAFKFDAQKLGITGQSMGGMYTNMIGATDARLRAAVPTGAGGHWTFFIRETKLRDGQIPGFLVLVLGTSVVPTFLHPALTIAAAGLEPADPMIYMPHLARRPLEGHPTRPIYEPVGKDDSYFPTPVYDAMALAYGHAQAGEVVWPEMQDALALAGLDGVLSLPVTSNMTNESGSPYTGAVLQFTADGTYDAHAIYSHRDDVKRQYSCFWDSFMKTGTAVIVPPTTDWAAPCP
ncbi:MAG: hypothetical protein JNL21_25520 [Myxococcales bacterium]|nr:hypothetical protein [Myxococcales bacterium]